MVSLISNKPNSIDFCVGMLRELPVFISHPLSLSHANKRVPPISTPLPFRTFAKSPTRMLVFEVSTASANNALGRIRSTCAWAFSFSARSCLICVASRIRKSGSVTAFSKVDSVMYAPCLRIDGSTSCVTQRLNSRASGLRLRNTREYKPDSDPKTGALPPF